MAALKVHIPSPQVPAVDLAHPIQGLPWATLLCESLRVASHAGFQPRGTQWCCPTVQNSDIDGLKGSVLALPPMVIVLQKLPKSCQMEPCVKGCSFQGIGGVPEICSFFNFSICFRMFRGTCINGTQIMQTKLYLLTNITSESV